MNIIDSSTVIDLMLGDSELDKVKCLVKDGELITRSECLDYSGSNYDDCKDCETGKKSKDMLLKDTNYRALGRINVINPCPLNQVVG